MKYVIIPYIALGFVLSVILGIEYNFLGTENLPTYWGSPFIFKQESLGSSLESYYSISGLVLNVIVWSFVLFFIDEGIRTINFSRKIQIIYRIIITLSFLYASFHILRDYTLIGTGFNPDLNYWYWNMDKEAKDWGGNYEGHLIFFIK
jgi:hypothetical protein